MGEFGVERRVVVLLGLVGALLDGWRVPAGEKGRDGARGNGLRVRGRTWSGGGRGGEGRYSRRGEVLLQGPEEEADLRWGGASSVKDRKAACAYVLVSSACAW